MSTLSDILLGAVVCDKRIGMTMTDLVLCLEKRDLLHMLLVLYRIQNFEPVLDRLAIALLYGREV